jgi:hypothetical protein
MQTDEISERTAEFSERNLAIKLRRQVGEWRTMRVPIRTRTARDVQIERRFRRRPAAERLSA